MSVIETTELIDDVKGDFEGGNSLSVNWDTLIRRAVENVLDNCNPETLKRFVPVYGGVGDDLLLYYCPTDVGKPTFLYPNDGLPIDGGEKRKYKYVPAAEFYRKRTNDTFTIEYVSGAQFIVLKHTLSVGSLTVDNMNALGTKTGGSASLNEHNYIQGGGAVQAVFTSAGVTLSDTLSATIDISDYLKGIVLLPSYLTDKTKLTSIEVRLLSSSGNYYSVITTSDSIGNYLIDGWNLIRFNLANATTTGSPVSTAIASWQIIGTTTSGNTLTIIFDNFTIQKTNPFSLEYYSNAPYISGSSGAYWQTSVSNANSDQINIEQRSAVAGILHYELCILTERASSFKPADDFKAQLQRKYTAYLENHPSAEAAMSYSKSPEIDISQDNDLGSLQDDTISIET